MINVVVDVIQFRLSLIGIESSRSANNELNFRAFDDLHSILCARYHAAIHNGHSVYGIYLYADPLFYDRIIKRVRMIVKPTLILHIYDNYSLTTMPRILDE